MPVHYAAAADKKKQENIELREREGRLNFVLNCYYLAYASKTIIILLL